VQDGTLSFFEPFPWQETSIVKLPDSFLGAIAWSPDGRSLVVARDTVLDLVDTRSSRQRGSLDQMSDWARVSIRGQFGTNAVAAPIIGSFEGHTSPITAVAWSRDGSLIASAARDGTVRLWSAERMYQAGSPSEPQRRSPARQPIGEPAVAHGTLGAGSGTDSRSFRERLESDPDSITQYFASPPIGGNRVVALSPNGWKAATAEGVRDLETSQLISALGDGTRLTALAWAPEGARLAVGRENGEILVRGAESDGPYNLVREGWTKAKAEEYAKRKVSPGFIDLTPSIGGYRLRVNDPDYSPVQSLAWSPDGRLLAAGGFKFGLELHNLETGEIARLEIGPGFQAMHHLAWSPDGSLLASAEGAMDRPFLVRLWNLQTGEARTVFEGQASALAWAPDGSLLGFADEDGCVRVWSVAADATLLLARSLSPVRLLCFDADASHLSAVDDGAGTGRRSLAYVWKLCNFAPKKIGAELRRLELEFGRRAVHGGPVLSIDDSGATAESPGPAAIEWQPPVALPPGADEPAGSATGPQTSASASIDPRWERAAELFKQGAGLVESDPLQALALLDEQEPIWRDLGDRGGLASCLGARGVALMVTGRHADALTPLREAEAIWRDHEEFRRLKAVLGDRGTALRKLGRHDEALAAFAEEEALCRRLDDREGLARSLAEQAAVLAGRENWDAALERLREQETLLDPTTDREALAGCLGFQGWMLANLSRNRETVAVLAREEAVLRELASPKLLAEALLRQVELLVTVGEKASALEHAEESAAIFASLDRVGDEAKARALLLKARIGRPTPLKGVAVLVVMLAPAAIGIVLGLWSAWLWLVGVPLVLISVFLLTAGLSRRLREKVEGMASKG
jgi:WD40 repeat protein/tetratricopeptide (TPR) repeat protein